MFRRRARAPELLEALRAAYPAAPDDVQKAVMSTRGAPRRDRVPEWVDEQVVRAAARRLAAGSGLADAAYPPDGDEGLRVYLPTGLADADAEDVPADEWGRACDEAWGDHGEILAGERELWWAEQLPVDALMASWRTG